MSPKHPRWRNFIRRLEGREGCNFREKKPGDATSITWRCRGGHDKTYATAILKKVGGIDIAGSLAYFDDHGGHCDCEIVFNVSTHIAEGG